MMSLLKWIDAFICLFYPRYCVVCKGFLSYQEKGICLLCNIHLPRTNMHRIENNPIEKIFWGRTTIRKASSYFYYKKGSDSDKVIHTLKYNHDKELGVILGKMVANELLPDRFFEEIDLLIPVPLHKKRQKERGYNQSEQIARGIAQLTGIPVVNSVLVKKEETDTQTRKGIYERWENSQSVFELITPEKLRNKHILLIDDVITTGSTLISCCNALESIPHIKISILTLAATER